MSVSVVFSDVEVSSTGWSLVRVCPIERGVSECDRESIIMKRPWPTITDSPRQKMDRDQTPIS
jgi:hypothetical protein